MHQHPPNLPLLESVRRQQEAQALQEYGRALKDLEAFTTRFESLQHQLQEANSLLQSQHQTGFSAQEMSRLWTCHDFLQRQLLAAEHAAQAARNRARLAFTKLLATRHISAVLEQWQEPQPNPLSAAPLHSPAAHPPSSFLRAFAQTRQAPLWN